MHAQGCPLLRSGVPGTTGVAVAAARTTRIPKYVVLDDPTHKMVRIPVPLQCILAFIVEACNKHPIATEAKHNPVALVALVFLRDRIKKKRGMQKAR